MGWCKRCAQEAPDFQNILAIHGRTKGPAHVDSLPVWRFCINRWFGELCRTLPIDKSGAKCEDRAANGYNSRMGENFQKVRTISPISSQALLFGHQSQPKLVSERGGEGTSCDAVL